MQGRIEILKCPRVKEERLNESPLRDLEAKLLEYHTLQNLSFQTASTGMAKTEGVPALGDYDE